MGGDDSPWDFIVGRGSVDFVYVGSFFALVAHFFDFFTHLKSSCIFDTFCWAFGVIF